MDGATLSRMRRNIASAIFLATVTFCIASILLLLNIFSLQQEIRKYSPETPDEPSEHLNEGHGSKIQRSLVLVPAGSEGNIMKHICMVTLIPRSGIKAFEKTMAKLKIQQSFKIVSSSGSPESTMLSLSTTEQMNFCKKVSKIAQRSVVFNKYPFINFSRFNIAPPILISFVRDPVERAISMFYFARSALAIVQEHNRHPEKVLPGRKYLKKDLEECLHSKADTECSYEKGEIRSGMNIEYFCGHEPFCREIGNEEAFEKAKKVASTYAVVGIAENWEKTLAVLENYVPDFFAGAQSIYDKLSLEEKNMNLFKPKVEEESRKILEDRLYLERQFYKFLINKLNTQYSNIISRDEIF